ncbi:heterotrimeric G-protein alpha subunit, GPA2-like protein [Desarmillaria tabescens]|uniref:Heterotrimeric G-protein alpha subunit, GPA2-like protein n=1 Tax=Armillaria tabescens TaxID=1929756 RepID=A0AA39MLU3_ARMTA|nr:heterotrimeric G-protein alpha subunit, GPA2-like protein [Desarmillaria tabescens]KAK0439067.1 heterotrimeric G-protein alpha subunit, GPA2-like protein [Desarmillaria tabescens]
MGICSSSRCYVVTDADRALHRQAEEELEKPHRQAKAKVATQVKVRYSSVRLGQQMRLICNIPFSQQDIEYYRQMTLDNLVDGMRCILYAMEDMNLRVSDANIKYIEFMYWPHVRDGELFPRRYYESLKALWGDPDVQKAWQRGNEAALPENLGYLFSDLDRLFDPRYQPTEQDIMQCRVRTIGITETVFHHWEREITIIDVGGQRSERRKWIHCFQDVTSILFFISLNGYDQCLVEDNDANQMQDAMTVWEAICRSHRFKHTSIILFLNKNDLFEKKIPHSDTKDFFAPGDARAGRDYFKRRFSKLATNTGRNTEREIYIHVITATDITTLRLVMFTVKGTLPYQRSTISVAS